MAEQEATLLLRIKKMGEEAFDRISGGLETIGKVAGVVGGAIFTFGAMAVKAFKDAELASNQLSQSMVQQGIYTTALKEKYDKMASSLQAVTTFEDDQITAAQGTLQAFVGQREVTEDLVKATLDLAQAKGMDLNSAAQLVGKSIAGEANALARYGIEVENSADKTKKMADVVGALNSKFGGQAEAAAGGLGALESLKNVAGDFMEVVGKRLAPVIIGFANSLKTMILSIQESGSAMDIIMSVFQATAQVGVVLKGIFEGVGKVIGTVLAGVAGSVSELIEGNFKSAWTNAKNIVSFSAEDMKDTWAKTKDDMAYVNELFLKGTEEDLKKEEDLMRASNERKLAIHDEHAQKMAEKQLEKDIAAQDRLIANAEMEVADQDDKLAKQIKFLDEQIKNEESFESRKALVRQRGELAEQQASAIKAKAQEEANKKRVQDQEATLNTIATLQTSHNSALATIGKAAAITQIAIETPVAIAKALSAFPPPFNFAAAGLVGAAMAAQAARIAGVQLAEGGIVSPTPGGTLATIGEGGRSEAVVPLPDDFDPDNGFGGGAKITLIVNGPVLGNEDQARQFAVSIDRELLKLRQRNESVAFDEDTF